MIRQQRSGIERDTLSPPILAMDDPVADVKSEHDQPADDDYSRHLGRAGAQLVVIEVDDRIESHETSERAVLERQIEHAPDLDVQVREKPVCLLDHGR